ncbi:MAG: hypothetical protein WC326_01990 [Candidatus Delongbacteria bacterium]
MGSEDLLLQVERVRALAQAELRAFALAIGLLTRLRRHRSNCDGHDGQVFEVLADRESLDSMLEDLLSLLENDAHLLPPEIFIAFETMQTDLLNLLDRGFTPNQRIEFTAIQHQWYLDLREQLLQLFHQRFGAVVD